MSIHTAIHQANPLIYNITNYVTASLIANALLAIGASPIMSHAIEEAADMAQLAQALVINIGTLDKSSLQSMAIAMQAAHRKNIPIILDPVGAGATAFRTQSALALIQQTSPQIIRGNSAEIMALAGQSLVQSKGVDSLYQSIVAQPAAQQLAKDYRCIVVISGVEDFIMNAEQTWVIKNGVALMRQVIGMGCTATALIGACCAVEKDYLTAAIHAMAMMGITGELAYQTAKQPAGFQIAFLDILSNFGNINIGQYLNLSKL